MKRLIALTAAVILLIAGCSSEKAYTFYGTVCDVAKAVL